jgi:hypothetical protein
MLLQSKGLRLVQQRSLDAHISFLLIFAGTALSQARDTASRFGSVSGAQKALVPGAHVTLTQPATGLTRTVDIDSTGGFVFALFPVGHVQSDR